MAAAAAEEEESEEEVEEVVEEEVVEEEATTASLKYFQGRTSQVGYAATLRLGGKLIKSSG